MSPDERRGEVVGDLSTVVGDSGYCGKLECGVGGPVQQVGGLPSRVKLAQDEV